MNPILFKEDLLKQLGSIQEKPDKQLGRILKSPDSEDLLSWNIFWPLVKLGKIHLWAPALLRTALRRDVPSELMEGLEVKLWHGRENKEYYPPKEHDDWLRNIMLKSGLPHLVERARVGSRLEGASEVDVVLESEKLLVFIEAKLWSDISHKVKNDLTRDQLSRNIDVGTYQAIKNKKEFYFILLTPAYFERSKLYWYKMKDFREDPEKLAAALPYRASGENAINFQKMSKNIGWLLWKDVIGIWKALTDNAVSDGTLPCSKENIEKVYEDFKAKGVVL